jgi:TPP-dependent pyruvate/acetoin dehydrogenase alpha subunit
MPTRAQQSRRGSSVGGGVSAEQSVDLLWQMLLIRAFDSLLPGLYTEGVVRGSSHAAIGQEAVAVGACAALGPADYITSTHRGHGHAIAKGADLGKMMAELLGRADGYCRGKGGSMHIADFAIGMLGANGIVGGGLGIAGGAALSAQLRQTGQVTVCFFGEGALNQGAFLEVGNLAAIWQLPLVLMCENNHYAMSARDSDMIAVAELERRAEAFGFPGSTVDGMDVLAVHAATEEAVARARSGAGPSLVVATCYRFEGHFSGDPARYRSKEEVDAWRERDPIVLHRRRLVEEGAVTEEQVDALAEKAERRVVEALEFARASPLPDPESAWEDVYA